MATSKYTQVLSEIESLQAQPLSIISLSELISSGASQDNAAPGRSSDVSALAAENEGTSPASLEADLRHYKVCFFACASVSIRALAFIPKTVE